MLMQSMIVSIGYGVSVARYMT